MCTLSLRLCLFTLFCATLVGCESGLQAGIPTNAADAPPPPAPGMDSMRAKMEAK